MSTQSGRRMSERELRLYAHHVIDKVGELEGSLRRQAAEEALEKAPNDAARQTILELAVSAPDDVTAAFVQAAVRGGSTQVARAAADLLLDIKGAENVLEVVSECLRSEDSAVRRRAVEALDVIPDPGALDLLADAMSSEDASIRRAATSSLGLVLGTKYHPMKQGLLARLSHPSSGLARCILESEDLQVRREVAQMAGFADAEQVLPVLEGFGDDPDTQVRREAVVSLATFGTEAAQKLLERKLDDPDYVVVACVLDALAPQYGRQSTKMLEVLKKALKHPSREVRRHAVLMLDHFQLSQVEETLTEALHDGDFEVERSAHELLRRLGSDSSGGWFGADAPPHAQDEQTLMVWAAGSMGVESEGAGGGTGAAAALASEDVILLLERAAAEGDVSTRVHAVSELAELRDIADSAVLQQAVNDLDEPVRSRAAASLLYTRDAGLLADIIAHHRDPLVRRSAIEALMANPGGSRGAGALRQTIQFTSVRTVGMELFGRFLAALMDADEGVKRIACFALQRYVEFKCPLPVSKAVRSLDALADDDSLSSLVRDDARQVVEEMAEARLAEPVVRLGDDVLEWRAQLARQAHALRRDRKSGGFVLDGRGGLDGVEVGQVWPVELGLDPRAAHVAAEALRSGAPLPPEVAQAAMWGLARGLIACLNAVYDAARAVRLMGESAWASQVQQWADGMRGGPQLDWGDDESAQAWAVLLPRLRRRAAIETAAAVESFKDSPDPAVLDEACADEDDWVRMAALVTRSELAADPGPALAEVARLCRSHADDSDFTEVLGPAAIMLAAAGQEEFVPVVESVLGRTHTDDRFELISILRSALREDTTAQALRRHLSASPLQRVGQLGLALALRCAGFELDGLDLPDAMPDGADVELRCASYALHAAQGDEEAVAALEGTLRRGQERERYCSAVYLGLVRVRSAVPIFASVSDQDAPFPLRSLCAGMLVRQGHRGGVSWFNTNAGHVVGLDRTRLATDLSRAVADVIPLMLHCKDLNLGRFV